MPRQLCALRDIGYSCFERAVRLRVIRLIVAVACLPLASAACGRAEVAPPAGGRTVPLTGRRPVPDRIVVGETVPDTSPLTHPISELEPLRVKALLEAGADANLREEATVTSWPPLALAMRGRDLGEVNEVDDRAQREITDLLLAHGADPNVRWCGDNDPPRCDEKNGVTPLMYAGTLGDQDFAELLLRRGADPSLRDWRGLTASDYWGVKTKPASWCARPRPDEALLNDARQLLEGNLWEGDNAEIMAALREAPDRSIDVVRDQRVCEAAATEYARRRMPRRDPPAPRAVVPVLVIRVGQLWLVDDLRDRGSLSETGVYSKTWRLLGWGMTGD
jgi:hypothetical protein